MSLRKNRSEPESEGWRCVDCDEADDLAPMFHDEVWHRMGMGKRDVICTGRACGRLGRTLANGTTCAEFLAHSIGIAAVAVRFVSPVLLRVSQNLRPSA